jgi:hypothetical protein
MVVLRVAPMPGSTTVPSRTSPAIPYPAVSPATGLFSPAQAREYLHVTHDQLLDLVRTERLRAVRNPGGQLCFAKDDLDSIPVGVDAEVAAAELITTKDTCMFDATMAVPSEAQSPVTNRDPIADINHILDDLRRQMARSPKWVDIDDAVTLYGVPAKTLKEWSRQGFVRKSKLGPTFQSKSLYNTDDINDVLCKMAVGKPPANALRKEA